jgi:hypothetical protein
MVRGLPNSYEPRRPVPAFSIPTPIIFENYVASEVNNNTYLRENSFTVFQRQGNI